MIHIYIYIYIFNFRTTENMQFLFNLGAPDLFGFKVPRFHHSRVSPGGGSFDSQGQLIKQNWHKYFSALRTFRFSPVLYVYRFLEICLICLND